MAISIVELLEKELPADDWLIDGLLTRGNTGFIMGEPKQASKSWLLLQAAWNLSEGLPIWGIGSLAPPRPLRTVYFTQEDTERNIQDRAKKHAAAGREPNDRFWIVPRNLNFKLDTPAGFGMIARQLLEVQEKAGPIDLVMFDPMRRIHGGDENDSVVIAGIWERLQTIQNDLKCGILIAHHIKKPPTDKTFYDPSDPFNGRGSGDIYGGADALVMVVPGRWSRDEKSWRRLRLHFESKRGEHMPPAELVVRFSDAQIERVG